MVVSWKWGFPIAGWFLLGGNPHGWFGASPMTSETSIYFASTLAPGTQACDWCTSPNRRPVTLVEVDFQAFLREFSAFLGCFDMFWSCIKEQIHLGKWNNISLTWILRPFKGWCSLLTMIPVRSQWGRYNLPRFIDFNWLLGHIATINRSIAASRPWSGSLVPIRSGAVKDPPLLMGKSTISTGPFSIANC